MISESRDEFLRILLLLTPRLRESCDPGNDRDDHQRERYKGPNDTPAMRRSSILFCKYARIGAIDFAEDEVVALSVVKVVSQNRYTQWGER